MPGGSPIATDTTNERPPSPAGSSPARSTEALNPPASPAAEPARSRARRTTILAVVGGLVVGVLLAVGGARIFGGDGDAPAASSRTAPAVVDGPTDLLPDDLPVPPGAGAASADDAVDGFLAAESSGDYETSFGFLSDADRARFQSPAGWVSAHADVLAPIVGYDIGDRTDAGDGRASITADLRFTPGLDPVVGLVPGRAGVTWDVVRGESGWGVALATSAFVPDYPADDTASVAARSWAESRQRCETPVEEFPGLVGSPSLGRLLCDTTTAVEVGAPTGLDVAAAQPFATAYGPEAVAAARVVRITGPAELGAVLVPIGDAWTVIGIVP